MAAKVRIQMAMKPPGRPTFFMEGLRMRTAKTRDELRGMILDRIRGVSPYPDGMDVVVTAHPEQGWTAATKPPMPPNIAWADCAKLVGQIVMELRREYDLAA